MSIIRGLDCEEIIFTKTGKRPSGEAFIRLASNDQVSEALERNKQHMGERSVYSGGSNPGGGVGCEKDADRKGVGEVGWGMA